MSYENASSSSRTQTATSTPSVVGTVRLQPSADTVVNGRKFRVPREFAIEYEKQCNTTERAMTVIKFQKNVIGEQNEMILDLTAKVEELQDMEITEREALEDNDDMLDLGYGEAAVEVMRKIRKDLELPTGKWRDSQRNKAKR